MFCIFANFCTHICVYTFTMFFHSTEWCYGLQYNLCNTQLDSCSASRARLWWCKGALTNLWQVKVSQHRLVAVELALWICHHAWWDIDCAMRLHMSRMSCVHTYGCDCACNTMSRTKNKSMCYSIGCATHHLH